MKAFFAILIALIFAGINMSALAQATDHDLEHDGLTRSYRLYVPESYQATTTTSLIFVLHGGGSRAKGMEALTRNRFNQLADEHGFIVVYPQGINRRWNDGRDTSHIRSASTADDVGFISALIDELSATYSIDPNQIFATGMSNGAMMSYRLACELDNRIAGIAGVGASMTADLYANCQPQSKTDILMILGEDDPIVPYDGGSVGVLGWTNEEVISAVETLNFWVNQFDCLAEYGTRDYPNNAVFDGTTVTEIYYACPEDTQVNLITIHGGGHTWAGGWQYLGSRIIGNTSRDINASDVIWEFFAGE